MNTMIELARQPALQRLAWVLIHFLWQGAAIGLGLALLLPFLHRASSHFRYLVICAALLASAIVPVITWAVLARDPITPDFSQAAAEGNTAAAPSSGQNPAAIFSTVPNPSDSISIIVDRSLTAHSWRSLGLRIIDPLLPYAVVIWFAGVLLLTVRLLFGWTGILRIRRSGAPISHPEWPERLRTLAGRMRVSAPVRILESTLVEVPTLIGWLRPLILLPASVLAGLTPEQLEAVLAHELAHIRRCDYLVNLIQTVIETVLFYHPAVWWISDKLREERENCCDDIAVETMRDRATYACALAALEQSRACLSPLSLAASGGQLLARIRRIAGVDSRKGSLAPIVATILMLGGLVTIINAATQTGAISNSQAFAGLIAQSTGQFNRIESLEFTSHSQGYYLKEPAGTPPLEKTYHFAGRGEKFIYEFKQFSGMEPNPIIERQEFDGTHYHFHLGSAVPMPSKVPEVLSLSYSAFDQPYLFLGYSQPDHFTWGHYVGLKDRAQAEAWEAAAQNAKGIRYEKLGDRNYMVATFTGIELNGRTNMTVWFSLSQGGFPVKYQLEQPDKRYREEYEVTNLQRMDMKGPPAYYPKTAKLRQYPEGGSAVAETDFELSDLKVNKLSDDHLFTNDSAGNDFIHDLDAGITDPDSHGNPLPAAVKSVSVRLRFVPGSTPMKGEASFEGAAWERLNPAPAGKGVLWLSARAGIGDTFPVQDQAGVTLFKVHLAAGDDDHVLLEVLSKQPTQRFDLARDQTGTAKVAGKEYCLDYPSLNVAAAANEKPTTPKATIVVTCK